jgi:O-acetylhomoserine/O-acetylserine sulfhydrylase-like pyridoxal-dependent enzyme
LQIAEYKELYDEYFPLGAGSIFTIEVKGGAKEQ